MVTAGEREGDVVSMLTCIGYKQPQDPPGRCNQVRILLYPLDRPAHRGAILLLQKTGQPFKEIYPVFIILENPSALDSSDDDMMQGARGIYAGLAGHAFQITSSRLHISKETTCRCSPVGI